MPIKRTDRIKRRIQAAVCVVAHQRKVIVTTVIAISRHHNLAVRLQRDAFTIVITPCGSEPRHQPAVTIKRRIQAAVCVVAHQRKSIATAIATAIVEARPRHQNLAVSLQRDAVGLVRTRSERRRQLAITIKGHIQTAVCVVAH